MATPTMTTEPPPPAAPVPLVDGEILSIAATYAATGLLPGLDPRSLVRELVRLVLDGRRHAADERALRRHYEGQLGMALGLVPAPGGDD